MTKKEKIRKAQSLLMEAGVDFKINNVEFENVKTNPESLFNDALLDEQTKTIKSLRNISNEQAMLLRERGMRIADLNRVIHKKNLMIEKLHKDIKDKDAVLSDVAEECRLSKVRYEELVASIKKYQNENEELRKRLATIVVNNVDAQALKSAESALGYKEKVISRLKRKNALLKKKNSLVITHNLSKGFDDFMEIVRLW